MSPAMAGSTGQARSTNPATKPDHRLAQMTMTAEWHSAVIVFANLGGQGAFVSPSPSAAAAATATGSALGS